jgi:hypothetical protein
VQPLKAAKPNSQQKLHSNNRAVIIDTSFPITNLKQFQQPHDEKAEQSRYVSNKVEYRMAPKTCALCTSTAVNFVPPTLSVNAELLPNENPTTP